MGDPHGDPQTSPQHADPHELGAFLKKTIQEIHVDPRVVGWSAGRHGLLEKSLSDSAQNLHWEMIDRLLPPRLCSLRFETRFPYHHAMFWEWETVAANRVAAIKPPIDDMD